MLTASFVSLLYDTLFLKVPFIFASLFGIFVTFRQAMHRPVRADIASLGYLQLSVSSATPMP